MAARTRGVIDVSRSWSAVQIAEALDLPRPTDQQIAVIEAPCEPTLVVAGAGSGKTETMASRVLWLVANRLVRPDEVLGLTFTRKAALELSSRLARRLVRLRESGVWQPEHDDEVAMPTVSTYHAYAGKLVSEHGVRIGVEPDAALLTEAACWQIASDVVARHESDLGALQRAPSTIADAVLSMASELAEHLVTDDEVEDYLLQHADRLEALPGQDGKKPLKLGSDLATALRHQATILPLVREYRAVLREQGGSDFATQMAGAASLARSVPAVGAVERQRVGAVLLDEFQDTSEAQTVLLAALFARPDLAVTAVGDPHQSIYGWRGASATTLSRFRVDFGGAGVPTPLLALSTSWRNDQQVLAAANLCAEPLRRQSAVAVEQLRPRPGAGVGRVEAARMLTHEDEAEFVADWVARQWRSPAAQQGDARPSIAVLCRARAQFATLVPALRRQGLPVEVVGLGGLLTAPEVADLVALLTVSHDPSRGEEWMRLVTGPVCRLSAADIDGLWAWARQVAGDERARGLDPVLLADAVQTPPEPGWSDSFGRQVSAAALGRVRWLARVVDAVRQRTALGLPELVQSAERLLGLDIEVASDPDRAPGWGRAQLDQLAEVAEQFQATAHRATLGGFVAWLEAARLRERGLEPAEVAVSADAVQVMTVHAAKGLEWDVVALPGMVEGTFPSYTAKTTLADDGQWQVSEPSDRGWLTGLGALPYPLRGDADGLPQVQWDVDDTHQLRDQVGEFGARGARHNIVEERRLAYVACTRARRQLLLTAPVWGTASTARVTSRFLTEMLASDLPVQVHTWAPMPEKGADGQTPAHPLLDSGRAHPWPIDPDAGRWVAADLTEAVLQQKLEPSAPLPDPAWQRQLDLLMAEHAARSAAGPGPQAPAHLSASAVVALARDPDQFWRRRRRPMPARPEPAARRGSAFHAWVQQHYAVAVLPDLDHPDLLATGASSIADPETDRQLAAWQRTFLDSRWAGMTPVAVEMDLETVIAELPVRCRIDAVFIEPDGTHVVVDWKTGPEPDPASAEHLRVQLSVYRLAYSRLVQVPIDEVVGVFYHPSTGGELRPPLLSETELSELLQRSGLGTLDAG